jgi:hypothetical protein
VSSTSRCSSHERGTTHPEEARETREHRRESLEELRLEQEEEREAAETGREAAEQARLAAEAARDVAIAAVRETSDSLVATLEHMRAVEELRRQRDVIERKGPNRN